MPDQPALAASASKSRQRGGIMGYKGFGHIIIALLITVLCSCNSVYFGGTPNMDENWGKSFESAKADQTLNPQASDNLDPVEGMDGQAADNQINKYRETFGSQKDTSGAAEKSGSISVINMR
jgi:hypothetical protein